MVERQVRSPIGIMPVFPPDKVSHEELERIAEFIAALPGDHKHVVVSNVTQDLAMHHWMALLALETDSVDEATHHVEHINELVQGDHLARMLEVLDDLKGGQLHDAEHTIQEMLPRAGPGLTEDKMHLRLALSALRVNDVINPVHHIDHFLAVAGEDSTAKGLGILALLGDEEFEEAEHELEELLGGDLERGDHDDAEEDHGQEDDVAGEEQPHEEGPGSS